MPWHGPGGLPAGDGVQRVRLPQVPRGGLRPPGLPVGLAPGVLPARVLRGALQQPAHGLLLAGRPGPRRPAERDPHPPPRREPEPGGVHPRGGESAHRAGLRARVGRRHRRAGGGGAGGARSLPLAFGLPPAHPGGPQAPGGGEPDLGGGLRALRPHPAGAPLAGRALAGPRVRRAAHGRARGPRPDGAGARRPVRGHRLPRPGRLGPHGGRVPHAPLLGRAPPPLPPHGAAPPGDRLLGPAPGAAPARHGAGRRAGHRAPAAGDRQGLRLRPDGGRGRAGQRDREARRVRAGQVGGAHGALPGRAGPAPEGRGEPQRHRRSGGGGAVRSGCGADGPTPAGPGRARAPWTPGRFASPSRAPWSTGWTRTGRARAPSATSPPSGRARRG